MRFSVEVSQKWQNIRNIATGSCFFSRSHAAWESNFAKLALKAQAGRHFYFGGEWGVLSGILAFLCYLVVSVARLAFPLETECKK